MCSGKNVNIDDASQRRLNIHRYVGWGGGVDKGLHALVILLCFSSKQHSLHKTKRESLKCDRISALTVEHMLSTFCYYHNRP